MKRLIFVSLLFLFGFLDAQDQLVLKSRGVLNGKTERINFTHVKFTGADGVKHYPLTDVRAIVYDNKMVDRKGLFDRFYRRAYRRNYFRKLNLFYHTGEYERWRKAYQFELGVIHSIYNSQTGVKIQFAQQLNNNLYLTVPFGIGLHYLRNEGGFFNGGSGYYASETDELTQKRTDYYRYYETYFNFYTGVGLGFYPKISPSFELMFDASLNFISYTKYETEQSRTGTYNSSTFGGYFTNDRYTSTEEVTEHLGLGMQFGFGLKHLITPTLSVYAKANLWSAPYISQNTYDGDKSSLDGLLDFGIGIRIPGSFKEKIKNVIQ